MSTQFNSKETYCILVDNKDTLIEILELNTVYLDSIQFKENILYIGC